MQPVAGDSPRAAPNQGSEKEGVAEVFPGDPEFPEEDLVVEPTSDNEDACDQPIPETPDQDLKTRQAGADKIIDRTIRGIDDGSITSDQALEDVRQIRRELFGEESKGGIFDDFPLVFGVTFHDLSHSFSLMDSLLGAVRDRQHPLSGKNKEKTIQDLSAVLAELRELVADKLSVNDPEAEAAAGQLAELRKSVGTLIGQVHQDSISEHDLVDMVRALKATLKSLPDLMFPALFGVDLNTLFKWVDAIFSGVIEIQVDSLNSSGFLGRTRKTLEVMKKAKLALEKAVEGK